MAKFFTDMADIIGSAMNEAINDSERKKIVVKKKAPEDTEAESPEKEPATVIKKKTGTTDYIVPKRSITSTVIKGETVNMTDNIEKVKELTAENQSLRNDISSLNNKVKGLETELMNTNSEKAQSLSEISSLKTRISVLETEKAQIESGKISTLEAREAEITKRETDVIAKETAAENGFELLKAEVLKQIESDRASEMSKISSYVEETKNSIKASQNELNEANKKLLTESAELAKKETKLVMDVSEKWSEYLKKQQEQVEKKFSDILEAQKNNSLAQITDISEKEKALVARELAVTERETAVMARENDANGGFIQKENELRVREAKVAADEAKNENLQNTLMEAVETRLSIERETLQDELNNVKVRHKDEITSLNEKISDYRATINSLKNKIDDDEKIFLKYGSDASSFSEIIAAKDQIIENLRKASNSRSQESIDRISELNNQISDLEKECSYLRKENDSHHTDSEKISSLQLQIYNWEIKYKNLEAENIGLKATVDSLTAKLKQISELYERKTERDARIKDIEVPVIEQKKLPEFSKYDIKASSETEWLNDMQKNFNRYEFQIHPRLLKSFHTSLKSADMSPLTVLAGVSGTGKSELPKLYSHFGGLNFKNTPVQPNWDSQESMLGFFNTIDNKFDAQDVLKFLVQAQKDGDDSLKDYVNLILLDEMNLAHIELYFAEFLSRLEERRDRSNSNLPWLPVKLGAGIDPYPLKLSRNVLWVGTMNQDETTKTLSDKVLDRGIIINFPRPKELINVKNRHSLEDAEFKQNGMLHVSVWEAWKNNKALGDATLDPYKKFIENMNDKLSVVGRSVGHRVWQSVVRYMENYPDVRLLREEGKTEKDLKLALDIAFEDQLVQKIMPKLRGIETRGNAKTGCLDEIAKLIGDFSHDHQLNIAGDFKTACEIGEGQFFWSGAEYLGSISNSDTNEAKNN